jgi:hypothetical protein
MGAPASGAGHRGDAGSLNAWGLRYRARMKRSPKLVVRRETIRALATLELTRAVGGDLALVAPTESCLVNCTLATVVKLPGGG